MKVALFVHCFFPEHFYGTEAYTLELAQNLMAMGHEPVVICGVFQGETRRKSAISSFEYLCIPVYCLDKNYFPHKDIGETYYQSNLINVHRKLLSDIQPDVIHVTHLINHTAALLDAAKALEIPVVATLTDFFGICFNNRLEAADGSLCEGPNKDRTNCLACYLKASAEIKQATMLARLTGRYSRLLPAIAHSLNVFSQLPGMHHGSLARIIGDIVKRPDVLSSCYSTYQTAIAPTQFLKSAYLANGLRVPMPVMHFGVDVPRAPKTVRDPSTPVRFGFIGQLAKHKGTDLLVNAFSRLPSGTTELYIYGSEDQDPEYVAALKSSKKINPVFFRGTFPKERLPNVLDEIDILVIPSRWYENSPLVLLNSLATHTPVIVSDVAGMTEFVEDGKNGFVFRRSNVDDLTRVMLTIIRHPELIEPMSKRTEYSRTTREMTEEVVCIYTMILKADAHRVITR